MTCRRFGVLVHVAVLFGLCSNTAHGQTLYGIAWPAGPAKSLITINTATGAGTLVAPLVGFAGPTGLSFRAGKLYTFEPVPNSNIIELNPATGAVVSKTNIGINPASWWNGGLAFRSDGIGFVGVGASGTDLYKFDITVPNNTLVTAAFSQGIARSFAFNSADVLYGVDKTYNLCTINQVTGALTVVGPTGIAVGGVQGMAFDASGKLYASVNTVGNANLYKINTATGVATLIGNTGFQSIVGLAFPNAGPPPPPPPGGGTGGTGGAGEGTYTGGIGPGGGVEGDFGFGSLARTRTAHHPIPILERSGSDPSGSLLVLNVSSRQRTQGDSQITPDSDAGTGLLIWMSSTVVLGCGLGLATVLAMKFRPM